MAECIFCQIAEHKIKSDIVYEDVDMIAFRDMSPQAPIHILIIPKKHFSSINDITESDSLLLGKMCNAARKLALANKIAETGYRLVYNTGSNAGQAVAHIHLHLLGGRQFSWPPG
jgi:histidine triad (HIT) family protein